MCDYLYDRRPFFEHFNQEAKHVEGVVRVKVVKIFDHTLGPLKRLLAECASRVKSHDCRQILEFFGLLRAHSCDVFGRLDAELICVLIVLYEIIISSSIGYRARVANIICLNKTSLT